MSTTSRKTVLNEMSRVIRLKKYSIRTERSYCEWVKRYAKYHKLKNKSDFADGARKVEQYLSYLAIEENVAPST